MPKEISKEKVVIIVVCTVLLLFFSFLSGIIYNLFINPSFGLKYSNIFFMISFSLIFFSVVYIYHILITKRWEQEKP